MSEILLTAVVTNIPHSSLVYSSKGFFLTHSTRPPQMDNPMLPISTLGPRSTENFWLEKKKNLMAEEEELIETHKLGLEVSVIFHFHLISPKSHMTKPGRYPGQGPVWVTPCGYVICMFTCEFPSRVTHASLCASCFPSSSHLEKQI